jgi:hypothetical protein
VQTGWVKDPTPSELLVERAIRAHLRPQNVRHVDGNRGFAIHDIEIDNESGPFAAVEVTEDRDPAVALWTAQEGTSVPIDGCEGGWTISMMRAPAQPDKWAMRDLQPFLRELDRFGVHEINTSDRASTWRGRVPEGLSAYDLYAARYVPDIVEAGRARLSISGWGEPVTGTDWICDWLEDIAASPRCKGERRKLGTSGLRQRHLALVINFSPASGKHIFNTLMAVESMGPPTRTPRLPNAITHAWVVSNYPTASSLYAAPDGWQVLGAF